MQAISDTKEPSASTDAAAPKAWYYLQPGKSETAGPVDAYGLAGLLDSNSLTVDTQVWSEGLESWKALKDVPELYSQVYYISSTGASVPPKTEQAGELQDAAGAATDLATSANPSSSRPQKGAKAAKPAVRVKAATIDPQLAEFQAEMAALGEATGADQAGIDEDQERQSTPPPDEQEFEDDDGTVYKWDAKLRKFQPKNETAAANAPDYGLEDMTFAAEEEQIPAFSPPPEVEDDSAVDASLEESLDDQLDKAAELDDSNEADQNVGEKRPAGGKGRKGGAEEVFERIADKQKKAKIQADAQKQWFDLKVNTSVYITGLPDDISEAQLAERFAQYGVLKPGDDGAPKVKIYRDKATQVPKGDGLVTFLYEPSVELATKLADGDVFRHGMAKQMTVQLAKFEMHGSEYVPKKKAAKKKTSKDRAKLADKVLGWGGFDDKLKPTQITVILKNLFHPSDFEEEPSLLADLEADIREECTKLGPVDKVRVFAGNPEGVVSVKFKTEEAAEECKKKMHGRYFGGRAVEAANWDGYTNYNVKVQETAEQQAARLERFANAIEAQSVKEQLEVARQQDAAVVTDADLPSESELRTEQ